MCNWVIIGSLPIRILPLVLLSACVLECAAAEGPFEPQYDQVTLEVSGRVHKPAGVRTPWAPRHQIASHAVIVREDSIEDGDAKDGKPAWSVKSADGKKIGWLSSIGDVALIAAEVTPGGEEKPFEIRRFNVVKHQWEAPLVITDEKKKPNQLEWCISALTNADRIAVLTEQAETGENNREVKVLGYRLALFRKGQDKPLWVKQFPTVGARPEPGVHVFASSMPDYAGSAIRHLSWLGDGILLCAGEKDDIVILDGAGAIKRKVERIWEYQRGFTGPSVWSHFISRFGFDSMVEAMAEGGEGVVLGNDKGVGTPEHKKAVEEARKKLNDARKAFDDQNQCAIVGGPFVVPSANRKPGDQNNEGDHIFVAIAKGPNKWNWGYLSDCIVYDLSAQGHVEEMVNLPRMVNGAQVSIVSDGLVWGCQKGAIVKLAVPSDLSWGMGPGGPDLICKIDWYRQFPGVKLDGWLTAEKVGDVMTFDASHAFRAVSGGYVAKKDEKIYRFPVSVVDLKEGIESAAMLAVPFKGELRLPETNAATFDGKTAARGPYLLGVTQLHIENSVLEVTLGVEGSSAGVSFDLKAALPAAHERH